MAAKDPTVRRVAASIAANVRWSQQDTRAGTQAARDAFLAKFEKQVDPKGEMPPAERHDRAVRARKAHMAALSLKARRARLARLAPA